jgi:hypothetical protein
MGRSENFKPEKRSVTEEVRSRSPSEQGEVRISGRKIEITEKRKAWQLETLPLEMMWERSALARGKP